MMANLLYDKLIWVYVSVVLSECVTCPFSTRGGFVALSPISPQEMFLQPMSHSREEKEEEEDDDYHSPYHQYHNPRHHHHHLNTLVTHSCQIDADRS